MEALPNDDTLRHAIIGQAAQYFGLLDDGSELVLCRTLDALERRKLRARVAVSSCFIEFLARPNSAPNRLPERAAQSVNWPLQRIPTPVQSVAMPHQTL